AKVASDDVVSLLWRDRRSFSGATFERAVHERGSKPVLLRGLKIVLVGGDHHDLPRVEVEKMRRQKIDFRVRLVAADIFRREYAIPRQTGVLSHIGEQRDVTV